MSEPSGELQQGLVSVGVPVYNGARFLREALDSVLAQDYANFEIIVSDNASEDETESICREYALRDARIRYHRSEQNLGPIWNFDRVYQLARGEYFMWAAHDDRRAPRCLSLCVAALKSDQWAVMCCMDTRFIDEAGEDVSDAFPFHGYHPTGSTPYERLRQIARSTAWVEIYSLFRTPIIRQTRLGKINLWGVDVVLMAEVCLRGNVLEVPEKLLDYRYFLTKTGDKVAETLSTPGQSVVESFSDFVAELIESVRLSPLSFTQKLRLKSMLVIELCLHNPSVTWGVGEEGFDAVRRALSRGDYRRALTLMVISFLNWWGRLGGRAKNSARYRSGKLRNKLLPGQPTT